MWVSGVYNGTAETTYHHLANLARVGYFDQVHKHLGNNASEFKAEVGSVEYCNVPLVR